MFDLSKLICFLLLRCSKNAEVELVHKDITFRGKSFSQRNINLEKKWSLKEANIKYHNDP